MGYGQHREEEYRAQANPSPSPAPREPQMVAVLARLERITARAQEGKQVATDLEDYLLGGHPDKAGLEGHTKTEPPGLMGEILYRLDALEDVVNATVMSMRTITKEMKV